jgi:ABC-type dipeptide/oligopeptide/nickel transport system permease subunit
VGLALLCLLAGLAVAHPLLQATVWEGKGSIYHPETGHDPTIEHPSGPSSAHWLGTDALGRDVLSSLTFSLLPALQVALLTALLVGALSLLAGSLSAYLRGWADTALTSIGDALSLIPPTIALFVVGLGRPRFGMIDAALLFGILYGLGPAQLVIRSRALSVVAKPFVDAARVAGAGSRRIMGVHLLPHLVPYAGIQMMSAGIWALASVAFVQYLGATDQARIGLGSMIYSSLDFQPVLPAGYGSFNLGDYTARIGWTAMTSAALAMTLISSALYLLAVGSREALVPETGRARPGRVTGSGRNRATR